VIGPVGNRSDWRLGQRVAYRLDVPGEVTDRTGASPASQSFQPVVTVGGHISLNGRPADANDLGGLLPGNVTMQKPQNEHLSADVVVRVVVSLGVHNLLLVVRQSDPQPGHLWLSTSENRRMRFGTVCCTK